jgi:predicted dehydrogenase
MTVNATSSGMRPIRVGLIGAGNWAVRGHLPVLSLLPEYEIAAIQSRRREAAESAATRFEIPHVLETAEQVAGHPNVDLAVVLTTAPQHEAGVSAALAAGKDVYSEWPLSTSTALSESLVELAQNSGKRHVVGLQRRLSATNRYVRDQIANGYVGKLRSVRMHVSMNYFQAELPKALAWTAPPENFSSMMAIYAGLPGCVIRRGWPAREFDGAHRQPVQRDHDYLDGRKDKNDQSGRSRRHGNARQRWRLHRSFRRR